MRSTVYVLKCANEETWTRRVLLLWGSGYYCVIEQQNDGTTERQNDGTTKWWNNRTTERLIDGTTDWRNDGTTKWWNGKLTDRRNNGTTEQWNNGTTEQQNDGTTEQRNNSLADKKICSLQQVVPIRRLCHNFLKHWHALARLALFDSVFS
jgi:hypothetical protein